MSDTIIAQITPIGNGGVYILRISGKKSSIVLKSVLHCVLKPRYATYLPFYDVNNEILDKGISIWFPSPNSYTGEDVLELQGHGNNILANLLIKRILKISNIRIARPGEFSERAFLNKKIDLIQAEAISDLINASSEAAIKASVKSLQGDFSNFINRIINKITNLRVNIEYELEFSEENINSIQINFYNEIKKIIKYLKNILFIAKNGVCLHESIKIVISGFPNSGKSSLFNMLSCKKSSIVTNIKGTTRDLIYNQINFHNKIIELVDTAGIRKTTDKVEKIGISLAKKEMNQTDILLFMIDSSQNIKIQINKFFKLKKNVFSKVNVILIFNKIDLNNIDPSIFLDNKINFLCISIKKKIGLEYFYKSLKEILKDYKNFSGENIYIARQRHIEEIKLAKKELLIGKKNFKTNKNYEILAYHLQNTQNFLNKITGKINSEDILNKVFSNFCIGK
ncbi:tRNA modification GTPase MnmE [Buchnera aphidicola (Chaitophorus sp. 3695)]|uniref:tRNA uridine-5-carboxymethylaminomethyl(34) synthesis GTPase MnmE n=1 Tax=Buchnera aphidicola TaxID=9 RepID=UPI003463E129